MTDREPRRVTCRRCGSDDIMYEEVVHASGSGRVVGRDDHGGLIVTEFWAADPHHINNPTLACGGCGHSWRTSLRMHGGPRD